MAKDKISEKRERTSFNLKADNLRAIKYLSFHDDKTLTDIVDAALEEYVAKWEKKNGPVPPQKA